MVECADRRGYDGGVCLPLRPVHRCDRGGDPVADMREVADSNGWIYVDDDGDEWYAQRTEEAMSRDTWDLEADSCRERIWLQLGSGKLILGETPIPTEGQVLMLFQQIETS